MLLRSTALFNLGPIQGAFLRPNGFLRISAFSRGWTGLCAAAVLAVAMAWPAEAGQAAGRAEAAALPAQVSLGPDGLPAVLSTTDARHYREIFALQEKGRWAAADKLIRRLSDTRLMGHVLAQRYLHPTAYRSKYKELKEWMAHYADHPEAKRIYKLALKRRPANYKKPRPPVRPRALSAGGTVRADKPYRSTKRLNKSKRREARRIKRQIRRNVLRTRLSVTEELLKDRKTKRLLDQVEIDEGYAQVAAAWFYYGKAEKAYKLAGAAAKRSGKFAPMAHWIAGLAAWRLGRLEAAAGHFEKLALSGRVSGWNAASGAYWAARAHLRLRNPAKMSKWLSLAARHPRTFYGLLARRALGQRTGFDFHAHEMNGAVVERLDSSPPGRRAMGLLQVGQRHRAEQELKRVDAGADATVLQGLLALAERARMPELAFRLGSRLANAGHPGRDDGLLDSALYPIPPWRPAQGFIVDRALVYALIRQESGFNPKAKSPDGARGLMQLMPSTASFVARDRRFRGSARRKLFDPAVNLDLGQRYIAYLLTHSYVQGDLFRLAAAYNGGPGNLGKWQRKMKFDGDALLFIESLPSRETRLFIERVLTNLWIYRIRLGQPAPSLDGIAAGDWPRYTAQDSGRAELASNDKN